MSEDYINYNYKMPVKKQTAVEWLFERINMFCMFTDGIPDEWSEALEQAKQIEKDQIKDAWLSAWKDSMLNPLEDKYYEPEAEQYYNENYEK